MNISMSQTESVYKFSILLRKLKELKSIKERLDKIVLLRKSNEDEGEVEKLKI